MKQTLAQFGRDLIMLTIGAAAFSTVYIILSLVFHQRLPW